MSDSTAAQSLPFRRDFSIRETEEPERDEAALKAKLKARLEQLDFSVYEEVECRPTDKWSSKSSRADLLAVPSQSWTEANGFYSIGFEVKSEGLGTGDGLIKPVLQAGSYMRSIAFRKTGRTLPRPDLFVVVSGWIVKTPIEELSPEHRGAFSILERVAWKQGVAFLTKRGRSFGFESNASVPSSKWHELFRLPEEP